MKAICLAAGVLVLTCLGVHSAQDGPKSDDSATGEVRRFEHTGRIDRVVFSPDGKLIATDAQVWEVATGKKISVLPLPAVDKNRPWRPWLAFSPDSQRVAVHRYDDIVLAEAATGKPVWRVKLEGRGNA